MSTAETAAPTALPPTAIGRSERAQGRGPEDPRAGRSSPATSTSRGWSTARSCAPSSRTRGSPRSTPRPPRRCRAWSRSCVGPELGGFDPYYGHAIKDRPILAIDRVRFAGEPVAAVAAEDEATAEAALREIDVDYEELPVVGTIAEAIADDAPLLHEGELRPGLFHGLGELPDREGNVCYRYRLDAGSVELAEAEAELTVEGEYEFPAVYQYAMETHTVVADFGDGELTLWASCQHPFLVRAEIADLFDLPLGRVRVIVPYLGGGFGSKSYTKMEPITAALAWKAGAAGADPEQRRRVDGDHPPPRDALPDADRGHRRRQARSRAASGSGSTPAPTPTTARASAPPAGDAAPGPYRWEAVHVDASCVYTNTSPAGSYRAFGAVHLQWIGELQVDELARRAGIDPLEIRRRNLLRPGEPVRPDGSGKPLDADLVGDVEKAAAAIGWGEPKREWTGRGLAVGLLAAGAHPVSRAIVRMEADGSVEVNVGTTEMGQGARTVMAQIAAEELAIDVDAGHACRAPTPASPPMTARPAPAARRRSPVSPCSAPPPTCASACSRPRPAPGAPSAAELEVADGVVRGPRPRGRATPS